MPEIIVMLTHNDVTVPNALDVFRASSDLPVSFWGFKDVGLSRAQMSALVREMKDAGKQVALEVVTFDDDELISSAQLAVEAGVDYFTGARYSAEVRAITAEAGIKYFPFCGDVSGSPIVLQGTEQSVVDDARRMLDEGADGVDLVAYRYLEGDAEKLGAEMVAQVGAERVIIAGSINSRERMERMQDMGAFAYTMGGALFDGAFVPGGDVRANLERVVELKAEIDG